MVAKDVCDVLGLTNITEALRALDDDEKGFSTADTPGGPQQMAIISEAGLYRLIFKSRKPEAKGITRSAHFPARSASASRESGTRVRDVPNNPFGLGELSHRDLL